MIGGESYRVGQIGGFFRVPLGYTNLYAVCTQIGADAAPLWQRGRQCFLATAALEVWDKQLHLTGNSWMTIVLFVVRPSAENSSAVSVRYLTPLGMKCIW